jgi:hypothetical protein
MVELYGGKIRAENEGEGRVAGYFFLVPVGTSSMNVEKHECLRN